MTGRMRIPTYDFGWNVVAVLFLCTASLMGTSIYGFIMIADSMARTHGWSDMAAGGLVSAMWLIAPLALFSAPAIERYGPWRLIVAGLLILALAFAGLAIATEFWQVYALRVLMGFGKVAIMTSVPVVVTRWFDLRFGTAISIVWAGGSAGGIAVAPLVEYLDRTAGFQFTTLALASGIAAVAMLAALTARAKPTPRATAAPASKAGHGTERGDGAVRPADASRAIIACIVVATTALGCANVAFLALKPQLFGSFGFDSHTTALIVGFNAAASMTGALAIGWLTDRFGLAWPGVAVGGVYLAGMTTYLFLTAAPLTSVAVIAAMLAGLGGGAAEVLWMGLLKREASGLRFPVVYGAWYFAIQVGYAVGGFVGGWALAHLGAAGFILVAALAFSATPLFSTWRSIRLSDWGTGRPAPPAEPRVAALK
ncbi:MFS transporter, aromatic acid:H+ symporter (AAHS) family [Sphingopyxis sp. LC81]|uniref:MFS transporter n=1 Tax=Sphingopyxis sp. LC81 TaxID=1502850 RepID=UPI000510499C|nr:MFS transporter [Sphingopyxis sp. LC81]KGB53069.1 MFS transporter, aromatic acid:H+ symporter (AAHS) family [Sphingopyxis sp. LC81]